MTRKGKAMLARSGAVMLAMTLALGGCGNDRNGAGATYGPLIGTLAGYAKGALGRKPAATTAATATVDNSAGAIAARALAANPNPLILATLENAGRTQAMAMVGENGGMRSFMTPNEQALILRRGMLVGTKGLGADLAAAELDDAAALIRARRPGTAHRVMRHLRGSGQEAPLPVTCTIVTGEPKSFDFAGRHWQTRQVAESCAGYGVSFQNSYLVTAAGQIPLSRQWISPQLGYVTIQTIRP